MTPFASRLPRGVRRLFRRPQSRDAMLRDLDEELATHLAMRVDELRASGMSEADAEAEARRRFGDPEAFRVHAERRAARRARRLGILEWIAEWMQDMRFARRQIAKAPGIAAIAVLTLALGIGANTAIFSVVHRLLLAPLPYPNGNAIVMPVAERDDEMQSRGSVDPAVAEAWAARGRTVQSVAAAGEAMFSGNPDGTVDTIPVATVTPNFLPLLGVRPELGRGLVPSDVPAGDAPATVALISHDLWQRVYGGRPDILGTHVENEGRTFIVVGVVPPNVGIPMSRNAVPAIWVPASLPAAANGSSGANPPPASIFATLRPGVSTAAASAELQAIGRGMPNAGRGFLRLGASATPERMRVLHAEDFLDRRETRAVQVLFVAVGALLLIACANVANLLLARAWTRQREFAVRASLGAGRRRLARQVLTESLALALAGGALGIAVAWAALRVIVALRPPALDHLADVHIEPAVLLWSLGVSIATGILFGCAPALLAGARPLGDVLRSETRGGSAGVLSRRVRSTLIVLQIAASLVLLVGSGLLVRSFAALQRMTLGYEPRGLVFVEALLGDGRSRDRRVALRNAVLQRLRAMPGVTDVALGVLPGQGWFAIGGIEAEVDREGHVARVPRLGTILMSPGYFRVTQIRLVEGRLPDSTVVLAPDASLFANSTEVLVNRALARHIWPNGHAIGARLRNADRRPGRPADPWSTVVGVVEDTRMPDVRGDLATLQMYTLLPPRIGDVGYIVRTTTSGDVAAPAIKRAVAGVDPVIYVRSVISGDTYLRDGLAPTRFAMALLTAFAIVALALSTVGLYGVIAYGVGQRTREIGVRVALGARPAAVAALVMHGGLRLTVLGVAIGTAAAAAATRVLEGLLYEVRPADPATFAAIALLVAAIALVATYVPARRALRIDPTETLRAD